MSERYFYSGEEEGIKHIWNNRLEDAEKCFIEDVKNRPRHALCHAEISVFKSFITEDISDRTESIARLTSASELASSHLKQYEKGKFPLDKFYPPEEINDQLIRNCELDTRAVLGDACTILAAFLVLEDRKLQAILQLRKGWQTYQEANKIIDKSLSSKDKEKAFDPSVIASIRFGSGLLYVLLSMIPPGFAQQAASLIGFKADKKLGLEYLWACYSNEKCIRSDFAGVIIALNNVILSSNSIDKGNQQSSKESETMINRIIEKYPQNSLFYVIRSLLMVEFNQNAKSIEDAEKAIGNSKHITEFPPIYLRILSNNYLVGMNWEEGTKVYERLVELGEETAKKNGGKSSQAAWSKVWHELKLGSLLQLLKRDPKLTVDLWTNVSKTHSSDKWSHVVIKTSKKYLRTGGAFSCFELMMLTTHFDKLLDSASKEKKEEVLGIIEDIAKTSKGALEPLSLSDLTKHKKGGGLFSTLSLGLIGGSDENDARLDNRCSYLVLKGAVLRALDRREEAISIMKEVLTYKSAFNDALTLALAYLELGKAAVKINPSEAVKYWKDGIKLNGYFWEDSTKQRFKTLIASTSGEEVEVAAEAEITEDQ